MPAKKTRKSAKSAQPDSTPVAAETPLGFFEKFYAPHGNPKWKQLDARGLAQIIIDAEQRRDEFQNQKAGKSPLPEKKVLASRRAAVNMPNDRQKKRLSPEGAGALGGLDVFRENKYAGGPVSRWATELPVHATKASGGGGALADAAGAKKSGSKGETIKLRGEKQDNNFKPLGLKEDAIYNELDWFTNEFPELMKNMKAVGIADLNKNVLLKAFGIPPALGAGYLGRIVLDDEYYSDELTESQKMTLTNVIAEELLHLLVNDVLGGDVVGNANYLLRELTLGGYHDWIHKKAYEIQKYRYLGHKKGEPKPSLNIEIKRE